MQIINLDKFCDYQKVILDGVTYQIKGLLVGQYLDDTLMDKLKGTKDGKEQAREIIKMLGDMSDIPEAVLLKQPISILNALIAVMQGNDPTAEKAQGEAESPEKK